ncbi:MAG: hypothetical protein IIX19_02560, partial [Alistipes sp.]|nr:hypothetical protein [Alistipes sp.]
MKRLFLLMAVILATALTATAQTAPKRHGWEENFSLYGDVESITIISYNISNGIAAEKAYHSKTYRFNDNGHVSEILYNDTPTFNYTYKFDKRGNVTQSRRENHDNGEVYDSFTLTIECNVEDDANIDEICKVFNGYGQLILSSNPD